MKNYVPALLLALSLAACSGEPKTAAKPAVAVSVEKAASRDMPVALEAIGTVEAYNSVSLVARISGELKQVHFKEGQEVQQGAQLVTIDPAPYQEKLREAEGQLSRDTADLEYKKAEADRYAFLVEKGAVSRSDYEKNRADANVLREMIRSDKARVEQARLNLSYCFIYSPISGRTGASLVKEGSIIEANRQPLVVVNQVRPIYVRFSIAEKHCAEVRAVSKNGQLRALARPPGNPGRQAEGLLSFIDNTVDSKTGMLQLKAEFPNDDQLLWPGQYVTVQLIVSLQKDAVVVPSQAVQTGQAGTAVFVVDSEMKASIRPVTVLRQCAGDSVIAQGLKPGETVVTDGQNKLQNGSTVKVRAPAPAAR